MMSLRPAIPDKKIPQHLPPPSAIAPLVVQFSQNCVPLSCFSRTISCLLALYDWKLSRAQDGSPQCLAHNVVSLFQPQTPGQIVLVDASHSFQIHINPGKDMDESDMAKICFQVQETIFTAIRQVFDSLHLTGIEISPAFFCPCPERPHNHAASPTPFNSKWFLKCSLTGSDPGAARREHMLWLETQETDEEKPSVPKPRHARARTQEASPAAQPKPETHSQEDAAEAQTEHRMVPEASASETERPSVPELEAHTEQDRGEAGTEHKVWLEAPATEKDKPSLPKLFTFKVHKKVGVNYLIFGTLLLNDEDGSIVRAIEHDNFWKCEQIVCRILSVWVTGVGKPVTWDALIETLDECDLSELPKDIHEKTQS
jgi:hypothetical protein